MCLKVVQPILHTIVAIATMVCSIGCTMIQYMPKQFDVKQGNYLSECEINRICLGMTKSDISSNIGAPTLQGLLTPNIWYYIFYHRIGNKIIKHQILTLKFDTNDVLITIDKKVIV
ncbi:outer membrane protein assembly factor BamE domain-containing protein [Candidatus Blochmannia vicinus (nom. nud.)]|uniref:outer membrane protein assembly factor BamE domain-containing protein n=1 Tax=Candidatus Blochmannia vicinus (nom. nud.) TaxID=251540 RepID=UPI0020240A95|nr:outer membrane protein assembly factor BamE [Candidatus Blochmannia vicinus]URJ30490.1 outer membrane protein assembly factor BamE [Candidatus Blochmannia vicinus]